jgi:Ca2+-binding RTX toxin-like protein
MGALGVAPVAADEATQTCFGRVATIVGTLGDDELTGTPGRDVIVGLGGNDTIDGMKWSDFVCGDSGDDRVTSNYGNDTASGGAGADYVTSKYQAYGGTGNDFVYAPVVYGGRGADHIYGGYRSDHLYGGAGDDTMFDDDGATGAENWYRGPLDEDWFYGGPGDDSIHSSNYTGEGADLDPSDEPDHVFGGSHRSGDECVVDDEDSRSGCEQIKEFENP